MCVSIFSTVFFSKKILIVKKNIKFYENPSSGTQVVPRGRTDGQTGMMNLILQLCLNNEHCTYLNCLL